MTRAKKLTLKGDLGKSSFLRLLLLLFLFLFLFLLASLYEATGNAIAKPNLPRKRIIYSPNLQIFAFTTILRDENKNEKGLKEKSFDCSLVNRHYKIV